MKVLRRLLTVLRSPSTLADAIIASAVLLRVLRDMKVSETGKLLNVDAISSPQAADAVVLSASELQAARRWERAMRRAVRLLRVDTTCLSRSLTLHRLLERDQVRGSRVCIGVQRDEASFAAHAWVDLHGYVLGDSRGAVKQWTTLGTARVAS